MTPDCLCVADTDGLHNIATASGNLKGILLDHLQSGVIAVPICAWQEFEDLYASEAQSLKSFVAKRIPMKRAYYVGAARIADKLNSGFPRGSHDNNVELWTASIASTNDYCILTSNAQIGIYQDMNCLASDIESWVEQLNAA